MTKKHMQLTSIVLFFIIIVGILLCYNPIVIHNWHFENSAVTKQERFFSNFNFDQGSWKCYVVIKDKDDISPLIPNGKVLSTSDISVLKQLQKIHFSYFGNDLATIESQIYMYKNGELYYCTSIWLGEHRSGLQTNEFGWVGAIEAESFCQVFSDFKRVYLPIIIF